jgi:hypothetical protein
MPDAAVATAAPTADDLVECVVEALAGALVDAMRRRHPEQFGPVDEPPAVARAPEPAAPERPRGRARRP